MFSEHEQQATVFDWARLNEYKYPELALMAAIPNGGSRGGNARQRIINGSKLKREGVKRGMPDIILPVPRGTFHGLFIEMKTYNAKGQKTYASKEQKEIMEKLKEQGYCVFVRYSARDATDSIEAYLQERIISVEV